MITRFNPTCNGMLHLGHLYIALINYHEAKQAGGKFILRLDDDQPDWIAEIGRDGLRHYGASALETLRAFGLTPDEWYFQSRIVIDQAPAYKPSPFPAPIDPLATSQTWYSYTPRFTYCKVVMDYRDQISLLIRGVDLLSEFSLYQFYVDLLGYPSPKHYYLPRLLDHSGAEISKTNGAPSVNSYLERYTPEQIIERLAHCILNVPAIGWRSFNVKRHPVIAKDCL
jgi:glutamyl/glutaminyl-tRNA synthetase